MMAKFLGRVVALALASGGAWFAVHAFPAENRQAVPAWRAPEGWTSLPTPPEVREGSELLWAGTELLLWGGCDPDAKNGCDPTADGYRFDPAAASWKPLPTAPLSGAWADGIWTGTQAVFLRGVYEDPVGEALDGVVYRPANGTWRSIPPGPIRAQRGSVTVWTGTEIVVWGGGNRDGTGNREGAAFDPVTWTWRGIAEAPFGLNLAEGVWTGNEVLFFGSLLDHRNWAETRMAVGAAYDPGLDRWRELPPSDLSPQATSADWLAGRLVAWDYAVMSQVYDPERDAWGPTTAMPLERRECYPDSAVVAGQIFAFYCGTAATYNPSTRDWTRARGGPLDVPIEGNPNGLLEWRFASIASSDEALFLLMEGVTVNDRGVPCYGCPGSPLAFWTFRPPA